MYHKILIPLENSNTDQAILKHIRPLAKLTKAEFVLVHVADGYVARLQEPLNLADSEEIKEDQQYLNNVTKELSLEGFKVKHYLLAGDPADGILKIAQEESCELIAMATHGHGIVKDIILGSVADKIRHKTSIPILMIKAKN